MPSFGRWTLIFLLLGLCPTTRPLFAKDVEKPLLDGKLQARVEKAVGRGVAWLLALQAEDGGFRDAVFDVGGRVRETTYKYPHRFGHSAIATLTLAHCGHGPQHPATQRSVQYLRANYKQKMQTASPLRGASSYSLSLFVMVLHELYARPPSKTHKRSRYAEPKVNTCSYPVWVRSIITEIVDWLLRRWNRKALFSYPSGGSRAAVPGLPNARGEINAYGDMSNTQYALLAIWAATRCGYVLEKKTLLRIADVILAAQCTSGPLARRHPDPSSHPGSRYARARRKTRDQARGFGYGSRVTDSNHCSGSMTAGGLSSLVIVDDLLRTMPKPKGRDERNRLKKLRCDVEQSVWDAIAWLAEHYTVDANPGGSRSLWREGQWHYYYLYSLERACVLAGKRYVGKHDWYADGAQMLVDAQRPDGRWLRRERANVLVDSCFALLFLTRAAPRRSASKRPVVTGTPGEQLRPEGSEKPDK